MSKKVLVLAAFAILAVAWPAAPTQAGEFERFIEIEKVMVGGGPSGPFEMMFQCTEGGGGTSPINDGETLEVGVQPTEPDTCTITETDSLGATTVTYSCTVLPFGDPGGATCDDDNTVSFDGDLQGAVHITITNDFTPAPTTTTTSPTTSTTAATTTTAAAAAVAITPTFTG